MLHLKIVMNAGAEKVPVMMLANGPQSNRFPFLSVFFFFLSFLPPSSPRETKPAGRVVGGNAHQQSTAAAAGSTIFHATSCWLCLLPNCLDFFSYFLFMIVWNIIGNRIS